MINQISFSVIELIKKEILTIEMIKNLTDLVNSMIDDIIITNILHGGC
jgi:hypothetical protein